LRLPSTCRNPASRARNRAARKSEESTKDRRRDPEFEDRKPRCRWVDPESHYEPHDTSHQSRRNCAYHRPSQRQRRYAEQQTSHPLKVSDVAGLGLHAAADVHSVASRLPAPDLSMRRSRTPQCRRSGIVGGRGYGSRGMGQSNDCSTSARRSQGSAKAHNHGRCSSSPRATSSASSERRSRPPKSKSEAKHGGR
jgi:hypothetical protein